jgi:ribulose 1,5-bisphosphate synthetase/thiazole synthase
MSPDNMYVVIVGAGIAGLASALAITEHLSAPKITLVELRPLLSPIGGAIGLTPGKRILKQIWVGHSKSLYLARDGYIIHNLVHHSSYLDLSTNRW